MTNPVIRAKAGIQLWLRAVLGMLSALLVALVVTPSFAQTFPPLTGRVVDAAHILSAEQAAALDAKLVAQEAASGHQLVVATIPALQGYDIADYGYRLGRAWAVGNKTTNDGAILIVAPTDRKVRIEVGYGLEPVLTDAYSSVIINNAILPHFKANDYPGGIDAGVEAIAEQIKLPPDQAQARMATATTQQAQQHRRSRGLPLGSIIWVVVLLFFFVLPMFRRMAGGRSYGGGSGLGSVILWSALNSATRGGSGWGGGGSGGSNWGGGGSGGGFSGGGGSFGGGGASGGW